LAVCIALLGTVGVVALQARPQAARAKVAPRRTRRNA
jgi:hypothetical protein